MTTTGRNQGAVTPDTAHRLQVLRQAWVSGAEPAELRDICRERFGLSDRSARRLMAQLRVEARTEWNKDRSTIGAALMARYTATYKAAMATANLPVAVSCLNGLSRLVGLPDLPAIEARAQREVCLQVLEVIAQAGITPEQRLTLTLALAARGLAPMPALEHQPLDVLARLAEGNGGPEPGDG